MVPSSTVDAEGLSISNDGPGTRSVMRLRLVAAVLVACLVAPAAAFVPASVRHEMKGRLGGYGAPRISVSLRCVFYESNPICSGQWRCRRAAHGGRTWPCPAVTGRVSFDIGDFFPRRPDDPSMEVKGRLDAADGTVCRLDGATPYVFETEVPALSGHYTCVDASGVETGSGVFGLRTIRMGPRVYNFD